ncbi:hypothetical protein FA13DRAFT_622822 [Coprinellus micaceus]|uniref:Uncharacterized protein n=1 Tax=Coprinellus micaceus TaxID=71717 RepID=A0A4Y7T685_COPMI|nr:hypothetical protein FA13DRAFT_622822 [Coprinellus micaceus]
MHVGSQGIFALTSSLGHSSPLRNAPCRRVQPRTDSRMWDLGASESTCIPPYRELGPASSSPKDLVPGTPMFPRHAPLVSEKTPSETRRITGCTRREALERRRGSRHLEKEETRTAACVLPPCILGPRTEQSHSSVAACVLIPCRKSGSPAKPTLFLKTTCTPNRYYLGLSLLTLFPSGPL